MSRLALRRPPPALVISLIALFVALGGTGYAALKLPKNSVGSKQIKKNAVTGSKLKANSITGSKVKNGSLSGADLKLGSLGTVPSATNATNAVNATNAGHAGSSDTAASADELKYFKHFDIVVGSNAPGGQDILTIGPFTLNALCDINNAGTDTATLQLRTTQNHSALDGGPETDDLTAGVENVFRSSSSTTPTTNIEYSSITSGAYAPDGTRFWGLFPVHVNPPGQPGKCEFEGLYQTSF